MRKREKGAFESPDKLNRLVEGTRINGDLTTDSNIRIDGEIVGNINCSGKVVIGETGRIKGDLVCTEADIEGNIEGDLKIENLLVLHEKAKISGNIATQKIEIHQGAIFLGNCQMGSGRMSNLKHANGQAQRKAEATATR